MSTRADTLVGALRSALGDRLAGATVASGEVTIEVAPAHLLAAAGVLRDAPELKFEQLIDLCGIDYRNYGAAGSDGAWADIETLGPAGGAPPEAGAAPATDGMTQELREHAVPPSKTIARRRFAVVCHLLSLTRNWRVRMRVFCADDAFPVVDSVIGVWPSANWFEREAFDLFGIVFTGHPDLRRILTDYGFIGHPFRKDFPISGTVEMRYDPEQQRVIYQPVTIEPREIVPRIVRVENYADVEKKT
ncbi:MAG: NADH-quinone oxidoreductase subunit C [Betaproteobacteria bacterium]|nr:NADH-quinone oxidoreductase subunit C [Betaproteobacteria bacterium]